MELRLKAGQFYGKTSQALNTKGFRFTEKSYSSVSKLPNHAHELSHFCFVLSGNYREKIGTTSFEREPSALMFYPPDVSHAEELLTIGRCLLVEIDSKQFEGVREYGARLEQPFTLASKDSDWLAGRMYQEFIERDGFSTLALESISTELLITASRQLSGTVERKPPNWLKRVKEYLNENFEIPPNLSELARIAGVHPTHLARVFRTFEHCTVGDYIRQVRIHQACHKMVATNAPLVQIALGSGFADQTHFNRSFRRVTGMKPTEYRKIFQSR